MNATKWGPWLPLAALVLMLTVAVAFVLPELSPIESLGADVAVLATMAVVLWLFLLTWSLYQALFQLLGVLAVPAAVADVESTAAKKSPPRFVILYMTCDDFLAECCASCLDQAGQGDDFQVVICDDSRLADFQSRIDDFCQRQKRARLVRRGDKRGFKAGNLNAAFEQACLGRCDWIVVVDADQFLPPDYLQTLAEIAAGLPENVAYIQAGRMPLDPEYGAPAVACVTPFQQAMQSEMLLFFERELAWRDKLGFSPFLGHGGAIRESAWRAVGGFPLRVSEDVAFSMAAVGRGFRGEQTSCLRSFEAYPFCFRAFLVRLCKFSSGAAELWRKDLLPFWGSGATFTEKADSLAWLTTYLAMPVLLINSLLGGYVAWRLNQQSANLISWGLSYLFGGLLLVMLCSAMSVEKSIASAIRYWFWAFAVYLAAMPAAAGAFVRSLVGQAAFHRTPKAEMTTPNRTLWPTFACGIFWCAAGAGWWSPFSPILFSMGAAFLGAPTFEFLHEPTKRGRLARGLVYLPGALFLWGLGWMWWEA